MNGIFELTVDEMKFNDLIRDYQMMQAYIRITQEMGPSEQLMAFINYDGNMESEIGLESFDSMSLATRHEILLSKMSPNEVLGIACENLISRLFGIGKKIKDGEEKIENKKPVVSEAAVKSFKYYSVLKNMFALILAYEKDLVGKAPADFDTLKWSNFHIYVHDTALPKLNADLEKILNSLGDHDTEPASIEKSGWTAEHHKQEVSWFANAFKAHEAFGQKILPRFQAINNWAKGEDESKMDVATYIHHTLGKAPFGNSIVNLIEAGDIIASVAPYFRAEEK